MGPELPAADRARAAQQHLRGGHHLLGLRQERASGRRQHHAGRRALEERDAQRGQGVGRRFTIDESAAFAARVEAEAGDDPASQVRLAWQLALGRDPSADELQDAAPAVSNHGLATLCRALFNSNEFLFLP